jgi:hypothetical protein
MRIEIGEDPTPLRVTRRPGEALLPENVKPTFHSGRKSLMAWGAVAHGKKGPLVQLDLREIDQKTGKTVLRSGLSASQYISQVLEGPLLDFVHTMEHERGCTMYVVEDGAPPHRASITSTSRKRLSIHPFPHPPHSVDLNPIKPIWNLIKHRVSHMPNARKSLAGLWNGVEQAWEELSVRDINQHTGKMKERCVTVKKYHGYNTGF